MQDPSPHRGFEVFLVCQGLHGPYPREESFEWRQDKCHEQPDWCRMVAYRAGDDVQRPPPLCWHEPPGKSGFIRRVI